MREGTALGNTEGRSILAFLTDVTGMTFLVQINPFPHQGRARVGVYPFFRPMVSTQLWPSDLVSQADLPLLRNQVSNFKTPIPESPTFLEKEKPHALTAPCAVGALLVQSSLQARTLILFLASFYIGEHWDLENLPPQLSA